MTQYFVYIIECENGALYTGFTTDIERRYAEHVAGSAKCKYTRSFPPKRLAAYWAFEDRSEALSMEAKIKRMSVAEKKALIGAAQY
ncbi:MAG: endonuclease [Gammaproteobacteria bacterium CG11_big_fil_rev_8_21_14_0_20_46_22]|nr:MAG: endonuclease [Gammaproteobacteria bacterium CG12_big_fil_rev_8_21_14_0_65_46_12]PIR10602.1 MAG: endonuclease [Gammaproteobacteria bacterium CG11_big_fil_rev_8_21_14_0_20_46_22]